jgi:hypothetical protein
MRETGSKTNVELATTDVFALSDEALKAHINALQEERNHLKKTVIPSVGECNTLIALAHAELSSRSADRMSRRALWLALAAFVISCLAGVLPIVTERPVVVQLSPPAQNSP